MTTQQASLQTALAFMQTLTGQLATTAADLEKALSALREQEVPPPTPQRRPGQCTLEKEPGQVTSRRVLVADFSDTSTWIDQARYYPDTQQLVVHCGKDGDEPGRVYTHENIPREMFDAFVKAKSPGRYYNTRLRTARQRVQVTEQTEQGVLALDGGPR